MLPSLTENIRVECMLIWVIGLSLDAGSGWGGVTGAGTWSLEVGARHFLG